MNPMPEGRVLCLYSTATQKGNLSALASLHDTSGHHDKSTRSCPPWPNHLQARSVLPICTLFYPGSQHLSMFVIRNPLSSVGGHSASRLSLLGLASGWWLCHLTVQSALAQGQYSTSVLSQKLAIWLGILHVSLVFWLGSAAAAVCHSSPWLEARGLLARIVEPSRLFTVDGVLYPGLPPHTPNLGQPVLFPQNSDRSLFYSRKKRQNTL